MVTFFLQFPFTLQIGVNFKAKVLVAGNVRSTKKVVCTFISFVF